KNDWKPGVAATQLLTAAAISLHNRCDLRAQAEPEGGNMDDLKHYGITFEGSQFVTYVVEPMPALIPTPGVVDGHDIMVQPASLEASSAGSAAAKPVHAWHGCEMRRLAQGDCTIPRDVERLTNWVNEIHRWGITRHAQSVQRDMKVSLADDGIDISALDDIA
ncbi:hypothetical protein LTR29_017716, partial [Friedmanniomyces endolithicus]